MTKDTITDLESAVATLKAGGVILYPTDTVWGIGCDATRQEAVERIYSIKRRIDSKAMISLVSDAAMLEKWVDDIPEQALQLADVAVRPLTIIYDHPRGLASGLLAADGSAAIRIASDEFCQSLCRRLRRPIVSTSANISGKPAPGSFAGIDAEIKEAVDYVATSGRQAAGSDNRPSSVIKISDGGIIKILRP